LKVLLDAIFGPTNFKSEIVWKRYGSHNDAIGYGAVHDVLLYYGASKDVLFNREFQAHDEAYITQRFRFADPDGRRFSEQNMASPNPRPNLTYAFTAANGVTYLPPRNGWKYTQIRTTELDAQGRLHYPGKANGRLRLKNYLDEMEGVPVNDVWTDIGAIGGTSPERMGYPTQKPLALLERIIAASSNPGDVVLDPFCGCGTAVDAAQKLGRRWIGIDITYLAIDLIRKRLYHRYRESIEGTYRTLGIPTDVAGAQALFDANPFDFERWAVSLLDGQPNERQVGDKGVDGRVRFHADVDRIGTCLVSVKGGHQVNPAMVRDLVGTVEQQKAEMGVLIIAVPITKGMAEVAAKSGSYEAPLTRASYPKVQIITVPDLLAHKHPRMPTAIPPYVKAKPYTGDQLVLGATI
jgi:hypothetical protein